MDENFGKQSSQNMSSTPNDDFLDWNDYDEEYEEEDNKNELSNASQKDVTNSVQKIESPEIEEDAYVNGYSRSRTNKDYSYYKKGYNPYRGRTSFNSKKYMKSNKPYNKGYDTYESGDYHHRSTYYKSKKFGNDIYSNKNYSKYNKDYKYDSKKDYGGDYEKKNFGDNKYYDKKYNNYNSKYKHGDTPSYNTREFVDDNKKYKEKKIEKELKDENEENISKPSFYNSKINNNDTPPQNENKYIKTEDFIQTENLVDNIHEIVKEIYTNLKSKISKNLDEEYGKLNINAKIYVPKNKILKDNEENNNNTINSGINAPNTTLPMQNYIPPY